MNINKEMLKKLKDILSKYGYSENGNEISDNFMTFGFLGENRLYLKFKKINGA